MSAPESEGRPAAWFVPAGFAIGLLGALCGIGGGILAGPLLHSLRRVPLKRAAATAILVVLATTLVSTVTELVRADSQLSGPVTVPLALGALLGADLGFRIARRIDERGLKRVFAVVLGLAGARVLLASQAMAGGWQPGALLSGALALVIGIASGILTPLLGVAGGILMVPALFLTLGGLGFGGARACALAAGAVAGLRALVLHARAGNVNFALGLPLALGAGLGAVVGVLAAHDARMAHVGRMLFGVLLLAQSARFALALRATR